VSVLFALPGRTIVVLARVVVIATMPAVTVFARAENALRTRLRRHSFLRTRVTVTRRRRDAALLLCTATSLACIEINRERCVHVARALEIAARLPVLQAVAALVRTTLRRRTQIVVDLFSLVTSAASIVLARLKRVTAIISSTRGVRALQRLHVRTRFSSGRTCKVRTRRVLHTALSGITLHTLTQLRRRIHLVPVLRAVIGSAHLETSATLVCVANARCTRCFSRVGSNRVFAIRTAPLTTVALARATIFSCTNRIGGTRVAVRTSLLFAVILTQ
jgi:hypothetical protein